MIYLRIDPECMDARKFFSEGGGGGIIHVSINLFIIIFRVLNCYLSFLKDKLQRGIDNHSQVRTKLHQINK